MKKKILFGLGAIAFAVALTFNVGITNYTNSLGSNLTVLANTQTAQAEDGDFKCKWATRQTSNGWEAICIRTGVGNNCTCGDVKRY